MWTRMQLKVPIAIGLLLFCGHTFLVIGLGFVSRKNIEFGVLWEHMRLTDLPVSVFLDSFLIAYAKFLPDSSYPQPQILFHLVVGGLQYFLWGGLLGVVWKMVAKRFSLRRA